MINSINLKQLNSKKTPSMQFLNLSITGIWGLDNSGLWVLPCTLWKTEQHPQPPSTGCQG